MTRIRTEAVACKGRASFCRLGERTRLLGTPDAGGNNGWMILVGGTSFAIRLLNWSANKITRQEAANKIAIMNL